MMANAYVLLILLIAISYFSLAAAANREYEIDTVKQSSLFLLDDFGFKEKQAHLQLNISDITFSDPNPNSFNLSQIGFFLSRNNRSTKRLNDVSCFLYHPVSSKLLYTFNNTNNTKIDLHFTDIDGEIYFLYFENCIADKLHVKLNVRSSMYNLDPMTGNRTYLSFQKINFPKVYSLYLLIYSCLALSWGCFLIYNKMKGYVLCRIHICMLAVVILKALSIFLELYKEFYISHTGCSQCWTYTISHYTSVILGGTPLAILMVLIFTGWSFAKPCFRYWDLALLVFLVGGKLFFLIYTVDLAEMRGMGSSACYWCSGLMALNDIQINCILGYFSMLSVTAFLYEAGKAHGKATPVLKRLTQFRILFLVYFFCSVYTAFVVFWFETFAETPKDIWISVLLKELGEVFLYLFIGFWLRPQVRKYSILVADDVENAACKSLDTEFNDYMGYVWGLPSRLNEKSEDL